MADHVWREKIVIILCGKSKNTRQGRTVESQASERNSEYVRL